MSVSTIVVAANATLLRTLALKPEDGSRPDLTTHTKQVEHQHQHEGSAAESNSGLVEDRRGCEHPRSATG